MQQQPPQGNGPQNIAPLHHLYRDAINTDVDRVHNSAVQANNNYRAALKAMKDEKDGNLDDQEMLITDSGWMLMPKKAPPVAPTTPSNNGSSEASGKKKETPVGSTAN